MSAAQHRRAPAPRQQDLSRALDVLLPWRAPLVDATLVRRYKRFLADVRFEAGDTAVAHCVNPGAMEGVLEPGARVWLTPADNPARKLRWTWSAVACGPVMVGVDTSLPNHLARRLLDARALAGLDAHTDVRAEFVHAPGSRVDFRLDTPDGPHDLEVKNVHLVYPDGRAYFPDSVSERATKHLALLAREARRGLAATVLFVVQRDDCLAVRPSDAHDPDFAAAARRAARAGVRFRAVRARCEREGLRAVGEVPVELEPYDLEAPRAWREAARARTRKT